RRRAETACAEARPSPPSRPAPAPAPDARNSRTPRLRRSRSCRDPERASCRGCTLARPSCPAPLLPGTEAAFEMLGILRVPGQEFARVAGAQDPHRLVAGGLRAFGIERDQLVPDLAAVLVDRGEERRRIGEPEIGLIESDLRRIEDRKSTRLNSSHVKNSYVVF